MDPQDYYDILGIDKNTAPRKIKDVYRDLALKYHPDRNKENPKAVEKMKSINEAYAVLSDPEKKREYDALRDQFGSNAYRQFRRSYSEHDIFSGSDIHRVFEEMARSFGIRGFDEIFKEFYGQGSRTFEYRRPGVFFKGFVFSGWLRPGFSKVLFGKSLGNLSRHLLGKLSGLEGKGRGKDIRDVIYLQPSHAQQGGPFAYDHRKKSKKLVVKIPPGIRSGQSIRLSGMGEDGELGEPPGDLYLTVTIRKSLVQRIKALIG